MLHMLVPRLYLRDFIHMLDADGSRDLMARLACSLFDTRSSLEQIRRRWRLGDEGEGAIRLNSYQGWCWDTGFYMGSAGVEFLAKVHGFDASSTQSGPNRRCGSSFTSWYEYALPQ
jgi:hypothetical protein